MVTIGTSYGMGFENSKGEKRIVEVKSETRAAIEAEYKNIIAAGYKTSIEAIYFIRGYYRVIVDIRQSSSGKSYNNQVLYYPEGSTFSLESGVKLPPNAPKMKYISSKY